jgi:hypothetical protein
VVVVRRSHLAVLGALLALRGRFGLVFAQEHPRPARPGGLEAPRLQLDRTMSGGELHNWLETA